MLGKIVELAHKISTEKLPTVFVNYMGHVNILEVSVYYEGWSSGADPTMRISTYMDSEEMEEIYAKLQAIYDDQLPVLKIGRCATCHCDIVQGSEHRKINDKLICHECARLISTYRTVELLRGV